MSYRALALDSALLALAFLAIASQPIVGQDLASLLEQAEDATPAAGRIGVTNAPPNEEEPAVSPALSGLPENPKEKRKAVPGASEAASAAARVRKVFADQYSVKLRPAEKTKLAGEMLALLGSTSKNADRWALLTEATRLACEAGNVETGISTVKKLVQEFRLESATLMYDAVRQLTASAPAAEAPRLTAECMASARLAIDQGNFATANKAIALAKSLARKTRNADLVAQANRLYSIAKDREKLDKRLASAIEELRASPADPDLNTEVGLTLCLLKSRWTDGLPFLTKSSSPALVKIADMESRGPATNQQTVALGDAWWNWAEPQKGPLGDAGRQRAIFFYNQAVVGLQGLERAVLEKRIASIVAVAGSGGTGETAPLAILQEVEVVGASNGVSKDGTFRGKSFTCGGKKFPASIFTHPSNNATAMIAFRPPAGVRRLRGHAGVFSIDGIPAGQQPGSPIVMSVVADGEVVWTSPQFTKRDQSTAFDVELRGCARLELRTTSLGACNTSWGAWLDPVLVK